MTIRDLLAAAVTSALGTMVAVLVLTKTDAGREALSSNQEPQTQ